MEEKLTIDNFLSISHLEWNPKVYNIITGEMGSGKSLCLKLLYFIYEIFNTTFFENSFEGFANIDTFYSILEREFRDVFFIDVLSKSFSEHPAKINYSIRRDNESPVFDFSITIKSNELKFSSKYVSKHFNAWKKEITESLKKNAVDIYLYARKNIINNISKDIGDFFPFAQIYFSDLRTLAAEPNNILTQDPYTNEFLAIKGTLEQRLIKLLNDEEYEEILRPILQFLHAEKITIEHNQIYLVHASERKVPLNKCSSGQREMFHLLTFLDLMQNKLSFSYGKTNVLFIEEPEVHLFPKEQKLFLELLGQVCNYLNKDKLNWRFYITTHSPYFLNALNNMLLKDSVTDKYKNNSEKLKTINDQVPFSGFSHSQVSGIFLQKENEDDANFVSSNLMQEGDRAPFLFSEKMEDITIEINDDYNSLELFSQE